jgi:hypothetical protein
MSRQISSPQANNSLNRGGIRLPFIREIECLILGVPPG